MTAAVITAAVTASCGSSDSSSDSSSGARETRPGSGRTAGDVLPLAPVRPDEEVVGEAEGVGPEQAVVSGVSDDLVYLYGSCAGPGPVVASLEVEVPSTLEVPCDGVVSRVQVYAVRGEPFEVGVTAETGTRWNLLVTARSEK